MSIVFRTCWIDRRTEETLGNMRFIDQGCETKEIHVGSPSSQGHSGLCRPNLKSRPGNWQKNSCFLLGPVPSRRIKIRPVSRDVDVFSEAGWALLAGPVVEKGEDFAKEGSMENRYKKLWNIVVPYYLRVGILLGTGTGTGAGWYSTGGDEFERCNIFPSWRARETVDCTVDWRDDDDDDEKDDVDYALHFSRACGCRGVNK
uniref:Uncharacterized protein n=1 Tax=Vespula pensylvanica TaxID=30213 RepID=A0A834U8V1_VESPE|nr:hypothetical protein H0235_008410 [Vespula pensylvanica]